MRILVTFACLVLMPIAAAQAGVQFTGGNGLSEDTAIKIVGAANEMEGIDAENAWMRQHTTGCSKASQALINGKKSLYDLIELKCGTETRTIYFDINDFFGKM